MGGGSSTPHGASGTIEEQAEALYPPWFIRGAEVRSEVT